MAKGTKILGVGLSGSVQLPLGVWNVYIKPSRTDESLKKQAIAEMRLAREGIPCKLSVPDVSQSVSINVNFTPPREPSLWHRLRVWWRMRAGSL